MRAHLLLLAGLGWGLLSPALPTHAAEPAAALPEISWEQAAEHLGQECVVTGKIVGTRNIGKMCFLNFHADFKNHFTVVVRQESFDKFPKPPETLYADQFVKVTGKIIDYQGKPEIVVTAPEQIRIVQEADLAPGAPPKTPTTGPSKPATPATPAKPPTTVPAAPAPKSPAPPAVPTPPATPTTVPAFTGTVTIASYNVLNLFDDYDDPYTADESTPAKPSEQLVNLAATIRAVNADVLAMEEVENRGVLERFNKSMLQGLGYDNVVLFEGNDERGIDVAVLSRLPVGPVTSYRHLTYKNPDGTPGHFRRDFLRVRIEPPDAASFEVFVVHLKSKRDGQESEGLRMGEAAAARGILDELLRADAGVRFVVCGDFNDAFESEPVRLLVGSGTNGLAAFFADVPEDARFTYNKEPYRSMIDFILCSPAMAKRYVPKSYQIRAGTVENSGSDHNPISARFDLR